MNPVLFYVNKLNTFFTKPNYKYFSPNILCYLEYYYDFYIVNIYILTFYLFFDVANLS